jgi:hypothetical protein
METNFQLEAACRKYGIPLVQCCNKNLIPRQLHEGGLIVNMEDDKDANGRELGGTHWVSVYAEKDKRGRLHGAYFDSFGQPAPVAVQQYLAPTVPYCLSTVDIQNINSGWCGSFCLLFLYYMSHYRSVPFEQRFLHFLQHFNPRDPDANLRLLKSYFSELRDERVQKENN